MPVVSGVLLLLVGGIWNTLDGQSFGKNKVQYSNFKWEYLATEHFDIYFNQGGRGVADFAAEVAEGVFQELSQKFNYTAEGDNPIVIVTYQSHNDFQQTNVSETAPEEATGGFTEFLKTRVVVPFEGDYENFRHVLAHEITHAVTLNMLYGQGFSAIVTGLSQARMPLWFMEGIAEYESRRGLDHETEMYLRDAVVNDNLPELKHLEEYGYVGTYKCGQSVLYWLAWRYGDEKIGELLTNIKRMIDFERALKTSIGLDIDELSKRWRRFIQERYWPQVARMDPPDRIARRLTDHRKEYCFVNNSPALSPDGQWLAFLSDRSDYFDIYLMSTVDGKIYRRLVRGQRSGKFEELHWLRPGITWSPDGKQIAFCARAGDQDALYTINVETGAINQQIKLDADALFSPSWSPMGNKIALVAVHNGQSDIGVVNLESPGLTRITDDLWDDADPSWSPDGSRLLFTSNRGDCGLESDFKPDETLVNSAYDAFDIFELNPETRELKRLTNDRYIERTPLWTPVSDRILYVSDRSGAYNICIQDVNSGESYAITNVVTGVNQPTIAWKDGTLAFASYYDYGYDIYAMNSPFGRESEVEVLMLPEAERMESTPSGQSSFKVSSADYSTYVFDRLLEPYEDEVAEAVDTSQAVSRTRTEEGRYDSHRYKVKFTPDLIYLDASYSPYYLMQGSGLMLLTDVLGNHQIYVNLDLNRAIEYSNVFFMYQYLARRINWGTGLYHYAYPLYSNDWYLDQIWGAFLVASYPFDRYNRGELGVEYTSISRSIYDDDKDIFVRDTTLARIFPRIGYVHDTSVWGYSTSPSNGGRWRVDGAICPSSNGESTKGYDFITLSADWRRYLAYHRDYTFAFRLSGGLSEGDSPQGFFLGGMMNWLNPHFDNYEREVKTGINDVYYSRFITPLRGVGYYRQMGTRYVLSNFEFRFPFVRQLLLGWPLPIYFRGLRGALFMDLGAAWEPEGLGKQLLPSWREWVYGYGFGIRIDLGIVPLEWDVAWSPETGLVPQHYFSLNLGF